MDEGQERSIERFFNSGLKLNQLRILVALADLKQVKLVAEAFHVTQPAISKQIAEMENALGVDLIRRVGQRVEFTSFGTLLTNRAREIIHQLSHARKDFDSLLSGITGKIALGVATTVTPVLIPEAVVAFLRRAPNAEVSLLEGTADRLFPMLNDSQIDLVVARTPAPPDNEQLLDIAIASDPLVLAVSKQHPLAFRMTPDWQDLKGNQWILPPPSSPVYRAMEALLHQHGLSLPPGCIHSASLLANVGLLSRTSLIGLLPKTLALRYVNEETLAIVPLDVSSVLQHVHVILHKANSNPMIGLMKESLEYCGRIYAGKGSA